jgi:hypothetical protein
MAHSSAYSAIEIDDDEVGATQVPQRRLLCDTLVLDGLDVSQLMIRGNLRPY